MIGNKSQGVSVKQAIELMMSKFVLISGNRENINLEAKTYSNYQLSFTNENYPTITYLFYKQLDENNVEYCVLKQRDEFVVLTRPNLRETLYTIDPINPLPVSEPETRRAIPFYAPNENSDFGDSNRRGVELLRDLGMVRQASYQENSLFGDENNFYEDDDELDFDEDIFNDNLDDDLKNDLDDFRNTFSANDSVEDSLSRVEESNSPEDEEEKPLVYTEYFMNFVEHPYRMTRLSLAISDIVANATDFKFSSCKHKYSFKPIQHFDTFSDLMTYALREVNSFYRLELEHITRDDTIIKFLKTQYLNHVLKDYHFKFYMTYEQDVLPFEFIFPEITDIDSLTEIENNLTFTYCGDSQKVTLIDNKN